MTPRMFISSWSKNLHSKSMINRSHAIMHWAFTIKITTSKPSQVTRDWMPSKDQQNEPLGLSHNLKSQVMYVVIQVNYSMFYPILSNFTRCVCSHINKLKKVCNLEGSVWISTHFYFDNNNEITNKHIYSLCKLHQNINKFQHGQITWQAQDCNNVP